MKKPIGGRGKRAPYQTIQMRVPLPIKAEVEKLIEQYRSTVLSEFEIPVDTELKPEYGFLNRVAQEVLADPVVTRHGKDRGAVRRAVEALVERLTTQLASK